MNNKLQAIRDYIHLYAESFFRSIPAELYILLIIILVATALYLLISSGRNRLQKFFMVVLFELVVFIYSMTVFLRPSSENRVLNLIPFWSFSAESADLQNSLYVENLMNVLMFIPFGLLIGCAYRGVSWKKLIIVALCFSISIEVLQYIFKRGLAELDDVMNNTMGTIFGFGIYTIIRIVYEKRAKSNVVVL